jgi:CRISPR/Cas system-associated exonuclease Cas4 (RecB family)
MEKLVSEKHLVPLADSERTYEVKKIRTWNMIKNEFVTPHVGNKFPSVSMEKWLESASTKVRGRIDLLIIGESGAEIIDYKTGDIIDENGNPKDEYQLQMKIYAALYHDNYSEWPKKLTVIGLNQERYNINFTPEECQKLILNLESKLDSINQIIMSIEPIFKLATPSPNACRFCMYRPSCRPYWRERNNSGDWPNDIAGRVVEMTISGIGLVRVVVENNGVRYIIRGLSKRQSLLAQNPVNIMVCNLSMDHFSGQFLENQMTMVFEEKFDISI